MWPANKKFLFIFYHFLYGACFVFCWFIAFLVLLLLFLDGLVLLCILKCVQRVQVLLFFGRFRIPSLCADAEKKQKGITFHDRWVFALSTLDSDELRIDCIVIRCTSSKNCYEK